MLDPQPYYVEEIPKRYSWEELVAEWDHDSIDGGLIWNLAIFKPRPQYEQDAESYEG